MKKILSFILVAVLCLGVLTGCSVIDTVKGWLGMGGEEETPVVEYNLPKAAEYVTTLYNKDNPVTASDYEVIGQVMISGIKYTINWTVDNELVTVTKGELHWTVNVDEKAEAEHNYKLTATIVAGDNTSTTVSFDRTVPEYNVLSFEEYMAAEDGAIVTIEGIVVGINGKSLNNKYNHLYLADAEGKGGYYCYSLNDDPAAAGIKVGMTVSVTAEVSPYSGMQETYGGTFAIVDETIKTVEPVDLTEKLAAGESLKNYVGLPVIFKGVTIGSQELDVANSQYLNFTLGDQKAYVRTYVSDFINLTINKDGDVYSSPDKTTIDEAHAAHFGWTANASGILVLYSGAPYLIPTSVDCFEYLEFVEKTADEKIAAELENLTVVETVTENTTITLPLAGQYYKDVTIAWAVDNSAFTIGEDGKLVIALGDEEVTLTLTATVKCGDKTETKTFKIAVDAAATDLYVPKAETAPVAGTAYKFHLFQTKLGKTLYITGEISGGRYIVTTDKADQAVDVYVETVEGGFKFYILVDGAKQYITVYKNADGKDAIKFDAAGNSVFTYNATVNAWVTNLDGTDKYLGTYGTFDTVSASNLSYITAENTGKEQFPAGFATLAPAAYDTESVTAPVKDTAYKFYLFQTKLGKTLYITGEISGGRYIVTTDKADQAVDVYVETVEGGFKFYILVDGAKQYITVYKNADGKDAIKFDAAGNSVFTYNATVNAWVTNLDGTDKYLGTYGTFDTVSASNLSYITAENTGKEQFPAGFGSLTLKEIAPKAETAPVKDTAYKFYLFQTKLGKTLYITGEISGGRYIVTTDKISKAVDVYVETVEGGFKFYILVDGAKQYITVYKNADGKDAIKFDAAGNSVFTYNATVNAWVTNLDGTDKYLGTYGTFDTVSASNLSYITAENTGKEQFPAGFATIEFVVENKCEHEWADATCTEAKKCGKCGETEGEPAGHKINEETHICTVCKVDDPAYYWPMSITEALAAADGKLVKVSGTVIAREGNGSVTIKVGDVELYAYKLATEVGVGDVITISGKMDSYNSKRQIASGATATVDVAHTEHTYEAGKCTVCGKADPATVTLTNTSAPITAVSQLTNGCKIVIAYGDYLLGASSGNFYGKADIVANSDKSYSFGPDAGVNVITVEINEDGTYALKAAEGYLLVVKGQNQLKFTNDKTDALAKWTIEFKEGTIKIHLNDGDNDRFLHYNASNPRFAAYKASSSQNDVVVCLVP